MCYLPTWPYFLRGRNAPRPGPGGPSPPGPNPPPSEIASRSGEEEPTTPDYEDPQPRCIRRMEPYGSETLWEHPGI